MATLDAIRSNSLLAHYYFANYLPASSMMSLWRTNRGWHQTVDSWRSKGILSKRVKSALKQIDFGEPLFEALRQSNGVISGSFVLKAIEGGQWSVRDLDIYRPEISQNDQCTNSFGSIDNYLWDLVGKDYKDFNHCRRDYSNLIVRSYRTPNLIGGKDNYHVMIIPKKPYVNHVANDWIVEHYDLDFLKNSFNSQHLIVNCVDSLIKRSSGYYLNNKNGKLLTDYLNRISKYRLRGFVIDNVEVKLEEIGGVELQVYYNNGLLWGARIHLDRIIEVMKLITINAPSSSKFSLSRIIMKKDRLDVDYNNSIDIFDIYQVIGWQILLMYHREEHLYYQDRLNERFGILGKFWHVR